MDVVANIIELKPNSLDSVEEWATTLNERADEVTLPQKSGQVS